MNGWELLLVVCTSIFGVYAIFIRGMQRKLKYINKEVLKAGIAIEKQDEKINKLNPDRVSALESLFKLYKSDVNDYSVDVQSVKKDMILVKRQVCLWDESGPIALPELADFVKDAEGKLVIVSVENKE